MQTLNNAQQLASAIDARNRCLSDDVLDLTHVVDVWDELISLIMRDAPRGSGIDAGTKLDEDRSNASKLVFTMGFHHMDEHGFYDGWSEHTCIVTPAFQHGFDVRITGRDRNGIKDYLAQVYQYWLGQPCAHTFLTVKELLGV